MKIDIESAFQTSGYNVYEFYQRPGVGFYIPLYQREYSWDKDNAEQLLEDIEKGVTALIEDDNEIRFLGTIITVNEANRRRIQPQDPTSLPPTIEKIIDGQQRLTTIALMSTLLYKYIHELEGKLVKLNTPQKNDFVEIAAFWKLKLIDLFSIDLWGVPKRKPKIIRGHIDFWIREGANSDAYKSEAASFLADFISALDQDLSTIKPKTKSRFSENFRIIDRWLKDTVGTAHSSQEDHYPKAWDILASPQMQENIWSYERPDLFEIVNQKEFQNKKSEAYLLCSLVQLLGVCHYLLERCCFTVIQPKNEEWAFDMFQSLNASGTPLTAIETFRPLVVNTTELQKLKFEHSQSKKDFERIENLFKDSNNAASKSKLTNEFLTSIAIVIDAHKLESHFSSQRKYLDKIYEGLSSYEEKCSLIKFMGNYADFYKTVWIDYKGENKIAIEKINSHPEAELVSLLILFLKKSNHRMAITILAYFYNDILEGKTESISNFVAAVKAIAAFYIIWRSALPNAGLDNVYRNFFKGNKNEGIASQSWIACQGGSINLESLKVYLSNTLQEKEIADNDIWVQQAASYLKYETAAQVCFVSLLISAHDTIPDKENLGLVKIGNNGSNPYLTLDKWNSKDLKELEHIAPKANNDHEWDELLYDLNSKLYDSIGNLTLLPESVNKSVGNKSWKEKLLYYKHLAEKDPSKLQELSTRAVNLGITLSESTIGILRESNFNAHILPLLEMEGKEWNKDFVEKRAINILEVVWQRISPWLF